MMKKTIFIVIALIAISTSSEAGLSGTPHDLTRDETQIYSDNPYLLCTFCHIPHSGSPQIPLWDKKSGEVRFFILSGFTKEATETPSLRILMCLSCHDRAIGDTVRINIKAPEGYIIDHPINRLYKSGKAGLTATEVAAEKGVLRDGRVECGSCHNPHSSEYRPFLNKTLNELCISCHEEISTGMHVMARFGLGDDHPVKTIDDPSMPGKKLSCVSCHNPHISITSVLLTKKTEICYKCHTMIKTIP